MKAFFGALLLHLAFFLPNLSAQPLVLERGPHHKVIGQITEHIEDGVSYFVTNSYTELATGMHYFEDNQWKESKEEIEIVNGHAVATKGPHQVVFAANLNSAGSVDMQSRDGNRFRTHLLGISYTDAATGQSVLIGEVVDTQGAIAPPNQVYHQNAFDGDVVADVRYTYRRDGFEQDIILLAAPPPPEAWNLDSATTRLEVWTEVLDAPEAIIREKVLYAEQDPILRQQMFEPDLVDDELDFGDMEIPGGYAFLINLEDEYANEQIPTGKSYETVDGRLVIIEKVDYSSILPYLQTLPQLAKKVDQPGLPNREQQLLAKRVLPAAPIGNPSSWKQNQFARLDLNRPAFVLDYATLNSSITNYTFEGDETYFITGTVYCYGTTVIEGGTVVKYQTNSARLSFRGPVDCQTQPGHPAIFTARDDDRVGEIISGSTGSVTEKYGLIALDFFDSNEQFDIHDIQVRHIYRSLAMHANNNLTLTHAQLSHGNVAMYGLSGATFTHRNVLFYDFTNYVFFSTHDNVGEHATFHDVDKLAYNSSYPADLDNSLLIAVTNNVHWSGSNVETNLSDIGIFQTVGAGGHYLALNSPYRDAGNTNITPSLLSALGSRTTHPPIILDGNVSMNTVLGPDVLRDKDLPDLGFHYYPIDYAISDLTITNATLLITNGAKIAFFGEKGITLQDNSALISQGKAVDPNVFLRYYAAQELQTNWGNASPSAMTNLFAEHFGNSPPDVRFRFTSSYIPSHGGVHLFARSSSDIGFNDLELSHSTFLGGDIDLVDATTANYGMTNNLLRQNTLNIWGGSKLNMYNNLIRQERGGWFFQTVTNHTWVFRDNLVDESSLVNWSQHLEHETNAYYQSSSFYSQYNTNNSELVLTSLSYETGSLGAFYLPSSSILVDAGSRPATNAALYHFTTQTNQTKEGTSDVDIGLHYVAVDTDTITALDEDGDGIPDYLEDINGNGSYDSSAGETDWDDYDSLLNISGSATGLKLFTPLR